MRLYTIQSEFHYQKLITTGILKSDSLPYNDFEDSYCWIIDKMNEFITKSDSKYPIWAWFKYNGKNRPDLRKRAHLNKNEIGYLIEFEIDSANVLLTDFYNWHLILNSTDDERALKQNVIDIEGFDEEDIKECTRNGWELINNQLVYDWNNIILNEQSDVNYIQATLWSIKKEQIISVKKFKSR